MEIDRGIFPRLLLGTFVIAILGFVVRGFGQIVVGPDVARLLAAPLFLVGVLLAVVAFVLSVLVTTGIVGETDN